MTSQSAILNLRPFHSGANGDVFLGQRSDNGENVVVKFLREAHLPYARKAFLREIKILAHRVPGLVPLLGYNLKAQRPWYVMPYVPGGSLTRYAGRLSGEQLKSVAKELALALRGLHALSIAHGDFKPDNILVARDGHLQVADPLGNGMGCTVLFSRNHGGTPGYWAPEVAAGGQISKAGDIYSFGATMYHLLTGRRPQDGVRLYATPEECARAPKITELIIACCRENPITRPTIQEVLRLLQGESWGDILAARRLAVLKATGAIGGLILLTQLFSK